MYERTDSQIQFWGIELFHLNKMAAKRFINQDPEYDPIPMEIQEKRMKCFERDARNATVKKIESILRAHFGPEINNKAKEVDTVDDMLYEARQMVDRLRAQVIMKYYCEAGSSKDAKSDETAVPSIHPTVKENLIGKSPKYVHPSSDSSAVKTEVQSSSSTSVTDNIVTVQNSTSVSAAVKSSDVAYSKNDTKNDEIPSRMPRMKTKCTVIVGNVSKFLPAHLRDEDDQFTHKWMVYVRGDKDSPSLEGIVKKVCFLLHSSYRPNDIVEVCNPPFHLVKRGWGEFQIRVQLHFKDPRNKPVDLLHPLRLDKTFTGLQTLGAETVFELMLYKAEDKAAPKSITNQSSTGPSLIHQAVPVNVVNKIIPAIPNATGTQSEIVKNNPVVTNMILPPDKVKKEKEELSSSNSAPSIASPSKSSISPLKNMEKSHLLMQSPSKAALGSFVDKPKSPVIVSKQSPLSKPLRSINPAAKNQMTNGVGTFIKCTDSQGRILLVPQTSLICMSSVNNNAVVKPFTVTQTVVQPQCTSNAELGKSILHSVPSSPVSSNAKLPSYVLKVIPTVQQSRPNQVLLIPVPEGTQKTQSHTATPSYIANSASSASGKSFQQSSTNTVITPPSPAKKAKPLLHWEQVMEGLRIKSYGSFVEVLKKMMKVFPLISQDYDPASIPFCAPSVEVFQSWNIGKQRAAEWQRAGMVRSAILKFLKTQPNSCIKSDDVWSRREVMLWCRKNGYTPPLRGKSSSAPVDVHVGPALNEISTVTDGKSIISSLESQNKPLEVTEKDDEEIDIISVNTEDEVKKKRSPNRCSRDSMPSSSPSVYFVKECAAEVGVKLTPLEVEPSVFMPVVEEMIHAACKEFASDLVRASLMQGYQRVGGKSSPEEITVQDVFCALRNTSTFDFITNKHMGVLQEPLDQS